MPCPSAERDVDLIVGDRLPPRMTGRGEATPRGDNAIVVARSYNKSVILERAVRLFAFGK